MKTAAERSVTEVRIVEAAVQLFSRQGYKGTSTREIAQFAGVNEATLFRYFARKTGLFWAAAESRLTRLKLGRELQNSLASGPGAGSCGPHAGGVCGEHGGPISGVDAPGLCGWL